MKTKYIPVTDWSKYHEWPTLGGLRHLIANKNKNGFDKVIKKAGGRLLIDEYSFFEWIESNQKA